MKDLEIGFIFILFSPIIKLQFCKFEFEIIMFFTTTLEFGVFKPEVNLLFAFGVSLRILYLLFFGTINLS